MGNGTISNSYNNTSYKYTIRLINYTVYSVIILSDFVIGTIGHRVSGYIVTILLRGTRNGRRLREVKA